ncbi:MAG: serine/threonine-protein kinase [Gemmatimonadales bacterium]
MTMTPVPEGLVTALDGRYRFEEPVGQGGMATVYLAEDLRHRRRVAVKVLRPDLSATLGGERFLREIEIAARLNHPNIVMLIDSGEAAGVLYYVMPFIEGESLRMRLIRKGRLDAEEVIQVSTQVADALAYAHSQGVVHRDVKPENILFAAGHAVVADFGVAKAVSKAADKSVTRTGYPVGTVGYMSPEQAAGFTDLTPKTDVYSLGCVVYEMLVGETPGHWPSEEAGRLRRLLEAREDHRKVLDKLPGMVEQVLVRALRMRPEDRFEGPRELVVALAAAFDKTARFPEGQARAIVARAAEIEATALTEDGSLSLAGMQRVAAEVGIAPEHVAEAAREAAPAGERDRSGLPYIDSLGTASAAVPDRRAVAPIEANPFLGSPTRIQVERVVDGEVEEADYVTLVEECRMLFGNVGQGSTLGRSLAWRTVVPVGQSGRQISMTVTPRAGRTTIRLDESLTPVAGALRRADGRHRGHRDRGRPGDRDGRPAQPARRLGHHRDPADRVVRGRAGLSPHHPPEAQGRARAARRPPGGLSG